MSTEVQNTITQLLSARLDNHSTALSLLRSYSESTEAELTTLRSSIVNNAEQIERLVIITDNLSWQIANLETAIRQLQNHLHEVEFPIEPVQ